MTMMEIKVTADTEEAKDGLDEIDLKLQSIQTKAGTNTPIRINTQQVLGELNTIERILNTITLGDYARNKSRNPNLGGHGIGPQSPTGLMDLPVPETEYRTIIPSDGPSPGFDVGEFGRNANDRFNQTFGSANFKVDQATLSEIERINLEIIPQEIANLTRGFEEESEVIAGYARDLLEVRTKLETDLDNLSQAEKYHLTHRRTLLETAIYDEIKLIEKSEREYEKVWGKVTKSNIRSVEKEFKEKLKIWNITESEYNLANERLKNIAGAAYTELLQEAEEYGEDDLAFVLAHNWRILEATISGNNARIEADQKAYEKRLKESEKFWNKVLEREEKYAAKLMQTNQDAWDITDVEYRLAKAKLAKLDADTYAELVEEAEEYGITDLALLLAHNDKKAAADLQAKNKAARERAEADNKELEDKKTHNDKKDEVDKSYKEKVIEDTKKQIDTVKKLIDEARGEELESLIEHHNKLVESYNSLVGDINEQLEAIQTPKYVDVVTRRSPSTSYSGWSGGDDVNTNEFGGTVGIDDFLRGTDNLGNDIWDVSGGFTEELTDALKDAQAAVESGESESITDYLSNLHTGGVVTRSGPVNLQAGEVVQTPGQQMQEMLGGPTIVVNGNIIDKDFLRKIIRKEVDSTLRDPKWRRNIVGAR